MGAHHWDAPLDRRVTLRASGSTLALALDHVARAGHLRLSYSPDLLPLARTACVSATDAAVGDLLVALLDGTGSSPVPAGGDLVVLSPARGAARAADGIEFARAVPQLERVVVTGTANGAPERASPFALAVVSPRAIATQGTPTFDALLDGTVPSLWVWRSSPQNALMRYGSLRGASSLGVSAPKVYIDGLEVANPLLGMPLDADAVKSVEVIRGPQGAALYGADAIDGVVNIVTRHEGLAAGGPRVEVRASAGSSRSDVTGAGRDVLAQDHALRLRSGSAARSASLGLSLSTLGAYLPGASARQFLASAGTRWIGARSVATGTARFYAMDGDTPANPALLGVDNAPDSLASPATVRQYTLGTSVTLYGSDRWTHALVAGVDGFRLGGVSTDGVPVLSAADSALRASTGRGDRLTLRASSTRRTGDVAAAQGTFTVAAELVSAHERTAGATRLAAAGAGGGGMGSAVADTATTLAWWSSSGVLAQGELALHRALFVSGGARLERGVAPGSEVTWSLLPMAGASWVVEAGRATVKVRGAYGRGIRPVRTVARGSSWMRHGGAQGAAVPRLAPEEQSGVEFGGDLFLGARAALHLTRFDQRASGLVQPVAVLDTLRRGSGNGRPGGAGGAEVRVAYLLQNVGAIDNAGWELQGTTALGALSVTGTLSFVQSRVAALSSGYRGDLRDGDRVLEVPARTMGLTAAWKGGAWELATTASRAADWIAYDRVGLARALADSSRSGALRGELPVGAQLRRYWRAYDGGTHLSARLARTVWRDASISLAGDNLLGVQRGEPDNATIVPGRTITVGVRTRLW
ncbi:MAG TPA: TonB-dependent receptor [Gemmatimonadaceae bacterium]